MKCLSLVFIALVSLSGRSHAAEITWKPDASMDSQLFPSLLIATATVRPDEDEANDPEVLGDAYGSVGISITAPVAHTKVKVTSLENGVMNQSYWSGELEKAGTEYYVAPPVNYKFDQLRKARQQVPLNVTFAVEANGKSAGEQTETITLRTINDCPFGVLESEETIDEDKNGEMDAEESSDEADSEANRNYTDMGWMFAAYVNENSPIVEKVLKEALATGIVDSFAGYQKDADGVLLELFAIWTALQNRGIKYSNITTTAGSSETVYSQHVRFVDESIVNKQANCVDGSVLFSSILRKLGLRAFLVLEPGHMYMGTYLTEDGDERVAIETTLLGAGVDDDEVKVIKRLRKVRDSLDAETKGSAAWMTFATAVAVGTQDLVANEEKFEAEDEPQYQITDINDARADGIMPISYLKNE